MDDIQPRLDQLGTNLDLLEEAVAPLQQLDSAVTASSPLPLLDRTKLLVLAAFALESSLFCSLGLSGVDARSHAVFRELQRVRQYMQKIEAAERPPAAAAEATGPASRLNKSAAIRFVRAEMQDPAVRQQLDRLVREEAAVAAAAAEAAAAAATTTDTTAGAASVAPLPRGRKRGEAPHSSPDRRDHRGQNSGGGGGGSSRNSSNPASGNLSKRPKHGSRSRPA